MPYIEGVVLALAHFNLVVAIWILSSFARFGVDTYAISVIIFLAMRMVFLSEPMVCFGNSPSSYHSVPPQIGAITPGDLVSKQPNVTYSTPSILHPIDTVLAFGLPCNQFHPNP